MTTPRTASKERARPANPQPAKERKASGAAPAPIPAKKMLKALSEAAKLETLMPSASSAKAKLVRDSFTIPKVEYVVLEGLKVRAATLARPTKKSEILRAGIAALQAMKDTAFLTALNSVPSLKTGRPSGSGVKTSPGRRAK